MINRVYEIAESVDTIFLDYDGVITKSVEASVELLNDKYNTNIKPEQVKSWNFSEVKSDLTDIEIEEIFNDKRFFDIVRSYDGVFDFMRKFRDKIIVFSKGNIDNIYLKRKWLDDCGFKDIELIGLPLSLSKGLINMRKCGYTMFIDDSTNNLEDCNANIRILFKEFEHETEWNKGWNGAIMNSWK